MPISKKERKIGLDCRSPSPQGSRFLHKAAIGAAAAKARLVRIADIEVRCSEGPVWIFLLFKQRFIDVYFYQLCQAEELL